MKIVTGLCPVCKNTFKLNNLSPKQIEWIEGIVNGTHRGAKLSNKAEKRPCVYLEQQGNDCAYKIGYSENINSRNKHARTDNCAGADLRVLATWEFTSKAIAHRFEQELLGDKVLNKYRGGTNKKQTEWLLQKSIREPLTLELIMSRIKFCMDSYLVIDKKCGNRNIYNYKTEK